MAGTEAAIVVEAVFKDFRLPQEQANSVKSLFTQVTRHSKAHKLKEVQHALQDISFQVNKGEFFGIVGRNGSGKSTLLKMLAGLYQPNQGSVNVIGRLVPFIELGVGFNGELTGRENVYLNGALLGFSKKEIDAQYDDIVEFAELRQFMDQKLKNYSSGMQVRLAFSVATRAEADILLVDEVLAVGDADFQRKCFNYFRDLKKRKKTVVFVSHDMNAVREYCDRAIMIEKSHLIASGRPDEVAMRYSRMFMDESRAETGTNEAKRWGTDAVKFSSVKVVPTESRHSEAIVIVAKVKATQDIEGPIFGFAIKNAAGQDLLGTNTQIKHYKVASMAKGKEITIRWEIPNVFGDGSYYVSLAAVDNNGVTDLDRWEESTTFTVFKEERTPYAINPEVQIAIT